MARERKTMFLDMKKAHLAPLCEQDVYVELLGEAEVEDDECGKLIHWFYGCRPAAQAWEEHWSAFLKNHGFKRLKSVPKAFVHETRGMSGVCAWRRLRVGRQGRGPGLGAESVGRQVRAEEPRKIRASAQMT